MTFTITRKILWTVFFVSAALALVDIVLLQSLFSWMILLPLVFVTGAANVGVALWKQERRNAWLAGLMMLALCGSYAALLAWSLT